MRSLENAASAEVSYRSLPHKRQLLILFFARFAEPLTASSIHSYMFFQLRYFDPSASSATLATQSGLLIGCKTFALLCTGLLWGRLSDNVHVGRKNVLIFGLLASSVATLLYGFSRTFKQALIFQTMDGALNAGIAMVRCMTAELNPEKRYRVRALTLLPLAANLGSLLGPLIGGFLASPGRLSADNVKHPYAAPNICVAGIQTTVAVIAMFYLNDTLQYKQWTQPQSSTVQTSIAQGSLGETTTAQEVDEATPLLRSILRANIPPERRPDTTLVPPKFRQIWTFNVIITLFAQFIIAGHLSTFASLWAVFLSLPTKSLQNQHPPFHFSDGLGLKPSSVGLAMSVYGFAGIVIQILFYPRLQERFGTIRLWRAALCVFPLVYIIAPYCALVASFTANPNQTISAALLKWAAIILTLILFVAGRTGVVPATTLLINDCTPHPSVRGTIHTTGVQVANLSRAVFPPMALAILGYGLRVGVVGLGFWFVAGLAVLSYMASIPVTEGTNGL